MKIGGASSKVSGIVAAGIASVGIATAVAGTTVPLPGGGMRPMAEAFVALNRDINAALGAVGPEPVASGGESKEQFAQRLSEWRKRRDEAHIAAAGKLDDVWYEGTWPAMLEKYDKKERCFPAAIATAYVSKSPGIGFPSSADMWYSQSEWALGIMGAKDKNSQGMKMAVGRSATFDQAMLASLSPRLELKSRPMCMEPELAAAFERRITASGLTVQAKVNRSFDRDEFRFKWRLDGRFLAGSDPLPVSGTALSQVTAPPEIDPRGTRQTVIEGNDGCSVFAFYDDLERRKRAAELAIPALEKKGEFETSEQYAARSKAREEALAAAVGPFVEEAKGASFVVDLPATLAAYDTDSGCFRSADVEWDIDRCPGTAKQIPESMGLNWKQDSETRSLGRKVSKDAILSVRSFPACVPLEEAERMRATPGAIRLRLGIQHALGSGTWKAEPRFYRAK